MLSGAVLRLASIWRWENNAYRQQGVWLARSLPVFFAALARINCQIEQLGKRCFYQRAPCSFMQ